MKKLLIVMVVALLALALVACGGETATTTKDTATTTAPTTTVAGTPETTKAPVADETTVAPATTAAPATTVPATTAAPATTVAPTTTTPVTTVPAVTTTVPATTAKNDTPDTPDTPVAPELDYTGAINLNEIGLSNVGVEDHHGAHDNNLVLAFYLGNNDAWAALYGAGTPTTENGLWTVNEGYTAIVTVNGVARETNRFTYYGFKDDAGVTNRGFFRFELAPFADLTTNGITCTITTTFTLVGADNKVICYANFEDLKYSTLDYEADADNPGKDALVVTPISGPDFDGGEGAKKLFDNKTTTKLCKSDRTPVIFSLADAKALGGLSLVTANDNSSYKGRTVTGFTLYGGNSEDAIDNVVLAVTEAGMADVDFTEYYYAIEGAAAYQYYKIVFDGTNTFQFSELWVYEAGASAPVEFDGKLPTTGIKEVAVDSFAVDVTTWGDGTIDRLFDGNTSTTKLGCGTSGSVTVEFSFAEATTLAYYTLYTGSDTDTDRNQARNPKSWVLYGKVGEEWVVLAEVAEGETGLETKRATPFSFEVTNPVECKEYKITFATNDQFQLNELKLFVKDATVKAPTATAIIESSDAEVVLIHRNDFLKVNDAGEFEFGLAIKADGNYVGGEAGLKTILDNPAYVYIKDVTAGGEFVKYEITTLTTARHCDIRFVADGFTPEEGHSYDIVLFVVVGEGNRYPAGTVYAIPSWEFVLGAASKGF